MTARFNARFCRKDWEAVRVDVMRWCLRVKIAQHYIHFGIELAKTDSKFIVENSSKDDFWGAIPNHNGTEFVGKNALGILLTEIRSILYSNDNISLLTVEPPNIKEFYFRGEVINTITYDTYSKCC